MVPSSRVRPFSDPPFPSGQRSTSSPEPSRSTWSCYQPLVTPALLQRLIQVRVANREQRTFRQLREEHPEPQAADRERRSQIEPVNEEVALCLFAEQVDVLAVRRKLRRDQHQDVDPPGEENPGGDPEN